MNLSRFEGLFVVVASFKNFFARAAGYLAIVNSIAIVLTFKRVYDIQIPAVWIVVASVVVFVVVGVVDYYYVMRHEFEHANRRNDLKSDLDEIKRSLRRIERGR